VKLLIAAGGTGGHIFPAVAVAEELKRIEPDSEVLFVGSRDRLEAKLIPKLGFPFTSIRTAALPRRISTRIFAAARDLSLGLLQACGIIRSFKPNCALITGGYVCAPVALAGMISGVPVFIQEQNAVPGLANRVAGRWARRVFLGFEEAAGWFDRAKTTVTGNPIRFHKPLSRQLVAEQLKLDVNLKTLFVMGGSQGASAINEAMIAALPSLEGIADKVQIIHQTGDRDHGRVLEAYRRTPLRYLVRPFFDEMYPLYSIADLMLCRAGGMTIAEITAFGIPAVLVPFARATNDHQTLNAMSLQQRGAGVVIPERELSPERLARTIKGIILDEARLSEMSHASRLLGNPLAAKMIADSILSDVRR
jgi:UDP-N-acetylglucosamine--N-acetylmuramyl-(pentapeptide) pyrophosphoryl-undecaprenol N-acetylglucosamine transferase